MVPSLPEQALFGERCVVIIVIGFLVVISDARIHQRVHLKPALPVGDFPLDFSFVSLILGD